MLRCHSKPPSHSGAAVLTEWFQAPPHALQHMWKRLRIVWFNAFGIVFLVGGVEWLLKVVVQPSGDSWKDAGNWKYHLMSASVSLSIGYVVNLIWRERSIAGPG